MNICLYTSGPLPKHADLLVAREGVFTLKHLFGRCVPSLHLACDLRGLAPLLTPPSADGSLCLLPPAPSYHLLTKEAPLPSCNPHRFYQYLLARNGVFVLARSRDVEVCLPLADGDLPGLTLCSPLVRFLHPRVPVELVEALFASARRACPQERLFYLLCEQGHWTLVEPEQEASEWNVQACAPTEASWQAVLEGHSHHRAAAFFSEGDNEAELVHGGFRLFFVMGRIDHEPEILVRVCVHGYAWIVPADLFFELPPCLRDASWDRQGGVR